MVEYNLACCMKLITYCIKGLSSANNNKVFNILALYSEL